LIVSAYPGSHDLNFSNRPVRTRMPGGVAGAQSIMTAPYADPLMCVTAQNLSQRMVIIALPKCRTKALVQNVCVRTDNRSIIGLPVTSRIFRIK
jgi:hypothetical protein